MIEIGKLTFTGLDELPNIARKLLDHGNAYNVWLFYGEMGAGKTTLIKSICECLKVEDTVNSPTFSLVNEYQTCDSETIYHFDFYRLNNEEEALDIGVEDYFYSGNRCFIEWPTMIPSLLPENALKIEISVDLNNSTRIINLSTHG